jgi:biopolymer transport protein ExbB
MTNSTLPLAFLLTNTDGSPMTPMELFAHGKEIMWPILLLSFVGITVVVERLLFIFRENRNREPEVVQKMLECVEHRDIEGALAVGRQSKDFVARILVYTLTNKEYSMSNAFIRASSAELARFGQGMATLDTVITAAPLLGLLGTVTGMMRTFAALNTAGGGNIADAAGQITGGVAEALIATACGLFIAVTALLPYNYLNARTEEAKHEVADASNALEILVKKSETTAPFNR